MMTTTSVPTQLLNQIISTGDTRDMHAITPPNFLPFLLIKRNNGENMLQRNSKTWYILKPSIYDTLLTPQFSRASP